MANAQTATFRFGERVSPRWGAAIVLFVTLCSSCRHTPEGQTNTAGTTGETEAAGTFYTVRPGDSLWSIANANGLSVDELAEVNGVDAPDSIQPGTRIFLPGVASASTPARENPELAKAPQKSDELERRRTANAAPLDWPLERGIIIRDFSPASEMPLEGVLLAAPHGTPVLAAASGQVLFAGSDGNEFGTLVILKHDDTWMTIYGHLAETHLVAGTLVRRGQQIGRVGDSGGQETPILHFQVRSGRQAVDPLQQLPPP